MTIKAKPRKSNIAALTFQVGAGAGAEVQLLPAGEFSPVDGRPTPWGTWKLTESNAPAVVALANQRLNEFVIDYEHQTQLADTNGQPAPAAGWFKKLEFRPGKGLWAIDVRWTARATQYITADEYKYISAVFLFDEDTGVVLQMMCAALTNNPGLHGMDAVQLAALTARFSMADNDPARNQVDNPSEKPMNEVLKALLAALGLPETEATTAAQAVGAVALLKASAAVPATVATALGLPATTPGAEVATAVATLKASAASMGAEIATLKSAGNPDPSKWVALDKFTQLSTQVAQLTASHGEGEIEKLLGEARAQGKCSAVVEEVWRDVGKASIAQLKALIDKTPGNPALAGLSQTAGRTMPTTDPAAAPGAEELAMCKVMGMTIEQFRAGA